MTRFILLAALLVALSGGLAACSGMQVQAAKSSNTDEHAGGGY